MESFLAIVQNSQKVTLEQVLVGRRNQEVVEVEGTIGADGWAKMAKACTRLGLRSFHATRECMVEGERGDLKTVWDALANDGFWRVERVLINGTFRSMCPCWATEEEKGREWEGLQVEIKPLSMVLVNVHHMLIL